MPEQMKIVGVTFRSSVTIYEYFCPYPVKLGDWAIADGASGYIVASILYISEPPSNKATKEVVAIINDTSYQERKKVTEERAAITKVLEDKFKMLTKTEKYRILTDKDPESLDLLRRLDVIDNLGAEGAENARTQS